LAQYDNGAGLGWRLRFRLNDVSLCGTTAQTATTSAARGHPTNGTWYHIAADFDGTTLRIYLDGVLLEETTIYGGLDAITVPFDRRPA
jgi:hypothetical protein